MEAWHSSATAPPAVQTAVQVQQSLLLLGGGLSANVLPPPVRPSQVTSHQR